VPFEEELRGKEKSLFWLTFLFPYLFIITFLGWLIFSSYGELKELRTIEKLYTPLKLVGDMNRLINTYKVYMLAGITPEANQYKRKFMKDLKDLIETLRKHPRWIEYCKCGNIFGLESSLIQLESEINEKPYEVFLKINELSQFLDNYYLNLNSRIRNIELKTYLVTVIFSNSFYRNLTSLAVQNYFYLKSGNGNYFYNIYFYKGKVQNSEYFFRIKLSSLSDKLKYPTNIFITTLESSFYKTSKKLLEDFKKYSDEYSIFTAQLFDFLYQKIHNAIKVIQLRLLSATALAMAGLILMLWLDYIISKLPLKTLARQLKKYKGRIYRDALTGLLNRRAFGLVLHELAKQKKPFSLILFDIDDFKKINDTYGHMFGDRVLKFLAGLVKQHLRKGDLAFRWGGEEFAIIVFGNRDTAYKIAERLRKAAEASELDGMRFTVSFGVGEYKGEPIKEFLKKVDEALYRAKKKGKNRVEIATI